MALTLTPMRLEVAMEVATKDVGMVEDMDTVERIIGLIDLVASRCPAAYRSTNATGKTIFDCGYNKWCTISCLSMPS